MRPSLPTLSWRNSTPGPPSTRTATAAAASRGDNITSAVTLTRTSKTRFTIHAGPCRFGVRIRITGTAPMWSA